MCCVSSLILQSFLDSKVVHVKIIVLHFGLYGLKLDRRSGRIEKDSKPVLSRSMNTLVYMFQGDWKNV